MTAAEAGWKRDENIDPRGEAARVPRVCPYGSRLWGCHTVSISDKPHPNETTVLRRIHKTFYTPLRHLTKPWGTGDHLQVHPQVLLLWHCCKGESLVHTIVGEAFPRHRRVRL